MGFLKLPSGIIPPFKKAIISLFFNVPAEALTAVRSDFNPDTNPVPMMSGILPLMLFGPRDLNRRDPHSETQSFGTDQSIQDRTWSAGSGVWVDSGAPRSQPYNGSVVTSMVDSSPLQLFNPGFIGIDCTTSENILVFRFPYGMDVVGTAEWASAQINGETYPSLVYSYHNPSSTPPGAPPYGDPVTNIHALQDSSSITVVGPDIFASMPELGARTLLTGGDTIDPSIGVRVTADAWHHVLLHIDFSTEVSVAGKSEDYGGSPPAVDFGTVTSTSKIYLAVDDVNKTGQALSYYAASAAGGGGPNDVLTTTAWQINSKIWDTSNYDPVTFINSDNVTFTQEYDQAPGTPTYVFDPPNMDFLDFYVPGDSSYTRKVKMSDIQVFTGNSIPSFDTSVAGNRRLFIDDGGSPQPPSVAASGLGMEPNICLRGSARIKAGVNLGNAGNLTVAGTINNGGADPDITP